MPVGILIPSRHRPHLLRDLVVNIHEVTKQPHTLHFCICDEASARILSDLGEDYMVTSSTATMVEKINLLYQTTDEALFYGGQDDTYFHPGWLDALTSGIDRGFHVAAVADGTSTLMTRRYVEEQSGCVDTPNVVLFPGYVHNFSETEFIGTAKSRGVFFHAEDAVIEHQRPSRFTPGHDETYKLSEAMWHEDAALFASREHLWR